MKTIVNRWLKHFFNLFIPEFNIRVLDINEKDIAQQLHYYLPAGRQVGKSNL